MKAKVFWIKRYNNGVYEIRKYENECDGLRDSFGIDERYFENVLDIRLEKGQQKKYKLVEVK